MLGHSGGFFEILRDSIRDVLGFYRIFEEY